MAEITHIIADELKVRPSQVEAAVKLLDEGNTVPFISRYRKEATGSLNDEQLRDLADRLASLRALEDKKQQVLDSIEAQGKLTDQLKAKILEAKTQVAVDDLYQPFRPKRTTRASAAREKGLEALADFLMAQKTDRPVEEEAVKYVTASDADIDQKLRIENPEEALQGARDIIAERVSEDADLRAWVRRATVNRGHIHSVKKAVKKDGGREEDGGKAGIRNQKLESRESIYDMYADFDEPIRQIKGYRVLALDRGETEGFLTVTVTAPQEDIELFLVRNLLGTQGLLHKNPYTTPQLEEAAKDAYDRLMAPAIERQIRTQLTQEAQDGAITVFKSNLTQLLMQPPIAGQVVLGWDPAFRTGCKIAVVDVTGKVLDTTVVFPTAPQCKVDETKRTIKGLIRKDKVTLISLGNGTASRESEQVVVQIIREYARENPSAKPVRYVIVNEAGASVYSASKLATEEFPSFDVGQRSAVSMARRLQDPLAELVKIDPKAVGVGQYQHDMDQKKLSEALGSVVEDCVNRVGVDLNTASASLLSYISGISPSVAKNIVAYREENGRFESRRDLLKVPKLGPKAFQQCAGFCRINGGKEALDATAVHPENYEAVKRLLKELGLTDQAASFTEARSMVKDPAQEAEKLGIGTITMNDILSELEKPARDPRTDMPAPILKSDVLTMEDLKPGMKLKGTVRNIVDFGVFVDIGVHQDGLVHISRLTDHFITSPLEVVKVGQVVDVTVVDVDVARKRIALSMNGRM